MKVTVNDEAVEVEEQATVAGLLETLWFPDKGIAVAVVGYTDALVATLFAQNGVPTAGAEYDRAEVERQLDALEQELNSLVRQPLQQ